MPKLETAVQPDGPVAPPFPDHTQLPRRDAILRLLALGMSAEQVAETLGLAVEEVRQEARDE